MADGDLGPAQTAPGDSPAFATADFAANDFTTDPMIDRCPEPGNSGLVSSGAQQFVAPTVSPVSNSILEPPVQFDVGSHRIFLDICCGATRPLSHAILASGFSVLSFDVLLQPDMDILDPWAYEQLLRVCSSGIVAYGAASPSAEQYSELTLRPCGSPSLRTPEHLNGIPGLQPSDLAKVQESHLMLSRCVTGLTLVYQSGGHVHLEQPPVALSWLEPVLRDFLRLISATCVHIAACAHGWDIQKAWLFASSFPQLQSLGSMCDHPRDAHTNVAGPLSTVGAFPTTDTAGYPQQLAEAFSLITAPLFSAHHVDVPWLSISEFLPVKSYGSFPISTEDGGGLFSQPDWSRNQRVEVDYFHDLRVSWRAQILATRLDKQLLAYIERGPAADPPFTDDDLAPFANLLDSFLREHDITPDWSIRQHQPMRLGLLAGLQHIMQDQDHHLFPCLQEGVSTGFRHDIPASGCFPVNDKTVDSSTLLSAHLCNWKSAEADPELTRRLVQEEIDKGWVFKFDGDLASAQEKYPVGVAIGRLGIAHSDSRPPRLVVDNSVCGLNARCHMPERSTLPSAKDVLRCYPTRGQQHDLMGLSLDVKSAHKLVVLKKSERGLVGFSLDGVLHFYRVAPFGAVFSSAWWSRLGGYLLRLMHHMIWLSHCGFLYVDDFLFFQQKDMMPLTATMLCVLCLVCRIPLSWKKLELSHTLTWIGWRFHISAGFLEIPSIKLDKVRRYIQELSSSSRTTRKSLEKFIGLMMWVTQVFPFLRIWLHYFYKDLHSIPATHFSIDRGNWLSIFDCLTQDLIFSSRPPGTALPIGGKLISVRHQAVSVVEDLHKVRLSDNRIWMRIRDPSSSRRTLSTDTIRILKLYQHSFSCLHPIRPMRHKHLWQGEVAADACASGDTAQIGGFIRTTSGQCKWFSERFHHADFTSLGIELDPNLQKSITCMETLAQIAILYITSRYFQAIRLPIQIASLSDNSGAESSSNKLFCTSKPLCYFVEKLCVLSSLCGIEMDVSHIAGYDNIDADALSRWDFESDIPRTFHIDDRVRLTLTDLWMERPLPNLVPPHAFIPWDLPGS